ncbi:hypothetical protein AcV7_006037, partial [Taiwanofungus camphoratus]
SDSAFGNPSLNAISNEGLQTVKKTNIPSSKIPDVHCQFILNTVGVFKLKIVREYHGFLSYVPPKTGLFF